MAMRLAASEVLVLATEGNYSSQFNRENREGIDGVGRAYSRKIDQV